MIRHKKLHALVAIATILAVATVSLATTPRHPDDLVLPPMRLKAPAPIDTSLSNGLRVLVFPNHDVPIVTLTAHVSMGSYYLPLSERVSYHLLSRLWSEGGAGEFSPDELDAAVAAHGLSLTAYAGAMEAAVSVYLTKYDLAAALPLWRDLLLSPGLDAERLERSKAQWIKDLQGINDNPRRLTETWFNRLLYGEETPRGVVHSPESIAAVTRDELRALHSKFVVPEHTVIGVAGDLTVDAALHHLEGLFGNWTADHEPPSLEPWAWEPSPASGVYWLPMDIQQCHVRIGRLIDGLTLTSPEYPHSRLLSYGFGYMRVYYTTREQGLSYGSATFMDVSMSGARFYGFGSTSSDKATALLDVILGEIAGLAENPLTEAEVAASQIFMASAVIANLETPSDVLRYYLSDIARGLPEGFSYDLAARYNELTADDLREHAMRWLNFGESPVVLVVGQPDGGMDALASLGLGSVTVLEPIRFGH